AHPVHPCRRCAHCRAGLEHLCRDMGHFGINLQGVFAGHFLVRADRARPSGDLPLPVAALAEPVCVCLEALAQARLEPGSRLLILGDGPFGALMAILARDLDLAQVVVAGPHDWRLTFAAGAATVNTRAADDPVAALREHGGELGYDAAILAVGSATAAQWGLSLLRPRGRLVVFSALPGLTPTDLLSLHVRELEIAGACNDDDRLDEAMAALRARRSELGRLVTHHLPLERYAEAFELAEHGRQEAMKVAFAFGEGSA
ncbi:MAG: zinc-binding dehydrogenase, partial [Gemmatimonadota bacterium]